MEILFRSTSKNSKDIIYNTEKDIKSSFDCKDLINKIIDPDSIFPTAELKNLDSVIYFITLIQIGDETAVFAVTKTDDVSNKYVLPLHQRIGCFTVTTDKKIKVVNYLSDPDKHGQDGTIIVHDINSESSIFEILLLEDIATSLGLWMLNRSKNSFEALLKMIMNQVDVFSK